MGIANTFWRVAVVILAVVDSPGFSSAVGSSNVTTTLKSFASWLEVPLVVRLEGTNVELGRQILDRSGLNLVSARDMKDGAEKIVELAG